MTKKLLFILLIMLFLLPSAQAKIVAKEFKGTTTNNSEFILKKSLTEKYVLLNFTSNYCGYCWRIYPYLIKMQEEYHDKLLIVCVHNMDSDTYEGWVEMAETFYKDNAQKIIDRELLTIWKASYLCDDYSDPSKNGWPHFFLINKEGMIIKKWFGANEKRLIKILKKEFSK